MEGFVKELAEKKVLSMEDVLRLKNYISGKYSDKPSSLKSGILANAVHQVLDKNLPAASPEQRNIIKQNLLKNTLLDNGKSIHLSDIFDTCVSIQDKSSDFVDNLLNWINLYSEAKISNLELKEYIKNINIPEDKIIVAPSIHEYNRRVFQPVITRASTGTTSLRIRISTIKKHKKAVYSACLVMILMMALLFKYRFLDSFSINSRSPAHKIINIELIESKSYTNVFDNYLRNSLTSNLPGNFKYSNVDDASLKKFLIGRKALLAEEPYFSAIISTAKEYNLNPIVLFSIAGQEQGFVTKQGQYSKTIANNPFNVFHSWREYNTNIKDACRIVCTTIINLCKDKPTSANPFDWMGKKYAEDPNWSSSVKLIYNKLEQFNLGTKKYQEPKVLP